jgi:hypothetical protein
MLRAPARLQQRRDIRAGPHLRDRQLNGADARIPGPQAVAVAMAGALGRALMPVRADEPCDLRFHQSLREHPDALAKDIPSCSSRELANERRQIHSGLTIVAAPPCRPYPARENSRKDVQWPLHLSSRGRLIEFPPQAGTLLEDDPRPTRRVGPPTTRPLSRFKLRRGSVVNFSRFDGMRHRTLYKS